jgi:hypothetical protein
MKGLATSSQVEVIKAGKKGKNNRVSSPRDSNAAILYPNNNIEGNGSAGMDTRRHTLSKGANSGENILDKSSNALYLQGIPPEAVKDR